MTHSGFTTRGFKDTCRSSSDRYGSYQLLNVICLVTLHEVRDNAGEEAGGLIYLISYMRVSETPRRNGWLGGYLAIGKWSFRPGWDGSAGSAHWLGMIYL